jgi:hypothetical protein
MEKEAHLCDCFWWWWRLWCDIVIHRRLECSVVVVHQSTWIHGPWSGYNPHCKS